MTASGILRCSVIAIAMLAIVPAASEESLRLWRHRTLGKALFENPATMNQAPAEFRAAVALAPDSITDRLNYGIALLRAGESEAAIIILERVEAKAPEIVHGHFNLGLAYKRQARYADAVREFQRMARLVPDEPVAYFQLGMLLNLVDDPVQSLRNFETAARLGPRLVAPRFQIYDHYRLAGDDAAAARALADFRAAKSALEASGESEDMDWCFYAELFDPAMPRPAPRSTPPVYSKRRLGRVDPATAGLALIDAFGEGRSDLLVWSREGAQLYRAGESPVGNSGLEDLRGVRSIAPGDFDDDGLADLCVLTEGGAALYRNLGGRFQRLTSALPSGSFESAIWLDYDHDYDLDLILLGGRPALLRNEGGSRFSARTASFPFVPGLAISGAALRVEPDTRGVDLAVSYGDHPGILYRDRLRGVFEAKPLDAIPAGARLIGAADPDGDGRTDLLLPSAVLFNRGSTWERSDREGGTRGPKSRRAVPGALLSVEADFNRDGRSDLAEIESDGALYLFLNRSARDHWMGLALAGVKNLKTAYGSEIEVKVQGTYEKRTYEGVPLLFSLAAAASADVVRITWPNGLVQNEINTRGDRYVSVREAPRLAGSCPTVFTWNGSAFQFIGDVLGVAPLGVDLGNGDTFPMDTDEYLQIPSGALVPRDGRLELRITEELHEVSYLDAVRLVAVDHPSGIAIVTNDKFKAGPPFPEFRLFGVRRAIDPIAAHDEAGRDRLPSVLRQDGVSADGFSRDSRGLAAMHWLDVEFPPESAPRNRSVLILNGWIDWADGSTFLAASQTSSPLTMPLLQTRDDEGRWHTVISDMGAPSGGPKTIAVDLTGRFQGRSRAVRIATSASIYWDRIYLSEDAAPPAVRITHLQVRSADLAWRGFSTPLVRPGQPERFEYSILAPPVWNAIGGLYTRYGEVRSLLTAVDDRFVIMASGDELRLTFPEQGLPSLTDGWTRDYLLYVDGWSKDADANTGASATVEPLPFHAMRRYPYSGAHRFPDDASHRAWIRRYNTRPAPGAVPELRSRLRRTAPQPSLH